MKFKTTNKFYESHKVSITGPNYFSKGFVYFPKIKNLLFLEIHAKN